MKIYFTASTIPERKKLSSSKKIVNFLEDKGHEVFEKESLSSLVNISEVSRHDIENWHKELISCLSQSEIVLIDGSFPSNIHVGFELGLSLMKGKPTILIFQKNRNPILIDSFFSPRLIKSEYNHENLIEVIEWCLEEAEKLINRRFTFFISPEIDAFLEKISNESENSRSEYIRKLIEKEMKGFKTNNSDYQK